MPEPMPKQTMQTTQTTPTPTPTPTPYIIERTLPSGVEVYQSENYWNASVEVYNGYLNLTAYPSHDGSVSAYYWSADGEYDDVPLPHLERGCELTWEQWFAWLDEQWPNHELRWAFELLSEAFPD